MIQEDYLSIRSNDALSHHTDALKNQTSSEKSSNIKVSEPETLHLSADGLKKSQADKTGAATDSNEPDIILQLKQKIKEIMQEINKTQRELTQKKDDSQAEKALTLKLSQLQTELISQISILQTLTLENQT